MLSWNKPEDRVAIGQMNARLQDAQVELLSAHCATDRIRLRFSTEEIARHGRRDVLRKAFGAATALHDFYSSIEALIDSADPEAETEHAEFGEQQILAGINQTIAYIREQRERYRFEAIALNERQKQPMKQFFSDALLSSVKIVELKGRRVQKPPMFEDARALGIENLPDITHMTSLTFADILVFNDNVMERSLFHALVQAVQFQVLGLQRFVELFVRSFVKTQSHYSVPLNAQAFTLECKFAANPTRPFSVEEQVQFWANQRRYEAEETLF